MKILAWILGTFVGIIVLFLIVQTLASERIEVVQLHTLDDTGETITTRLWIMMATNTFESVQTDLAGFHGCNRTSW
ncbi:MAG: hypothetical protein IIA75_00085 [Proteobacteria bacterium]|nr:hypothetical protein [Pseudomonadota bacterium]